MNGEFGLAQELYDAGSMEGPDKSGKIFIMEHVDEEDWCKGSQILRNLRLFAEF